MTDLRVMLRELKRWKIDIVEKYPRLKLSGGCDRVRKHYEAELKAHPEEEAQIILELSQYDEGVKEMLEERIAIRWADGLSDDPLEAILCNIT